MNKSFKIFVVLSSAILFCAIFSAPAFASQTPYNFQVYANGNSSSLGLVPGSGGSGNKPCANPNSNLAPSGGIQVKAGDVISGTAYGSWSHDSGTSIYGPNGYSGQTGDACLPQIGVLGMKLVGNDGTVSWMSAGSNFNATMSKTGTLYFFFSDSDQDNNRGSVSVTISVTSTGNLYCANGTTMTATETVAAITAGKLTITTSSQSNQTTYHINNTTGCSAPLIAASYKMFTTQLSAQQFFADSGVVNISTNGNTDITVPVASCMTQSDLWYQTAPHNFTADTAAGYAGYTIIYGGPISSAALCQSCTPNSTKKCVGNSVYNFDSCGIQGSLYQQCSSNQTCSNGACITNQCTPNWQTSAWTTCVDGSQTRTATDLNNCGTNNGKPVCYQSCGSSTDCIWKGHCAGDSCTTFNDCDGNLVCNSGKCGPIGGNGGGGGGGTSCTASWQTGTWSACTNGQQTRTCSDSNNCGDATNEPATSQSCTSGGGGTTFDQGMISFTFDDGWASAYQNAYPLLDKYGIKGTEYAVEDTIGDSADGFMTSTQLLDLQNRGYEIEGHTKTHVDLSTINSTQLTDEVVNSKSDLEAMGINTITSFDYPYGVYSTAIEQVVKNSGYLGARTSDAGYVQKGDDPYLLKAMTIMNTTSVSQIEQWIDSANANKTWLVLVIHQVDDLGNPYDISPSNLSQVVDYVHQSGIKTVRVSEGLAQM